MTWLWFMLGVTVGVWLSVAAYKFGEMRADRRFRREVRSRKEAALQRIMAQQYTAGDISAPQMPDERG